MPELPIKEKIMEEIKSRLEAIDTSDSRYWTKVLEVRRTRDTMPSDARSGQVYLYEGEDDKADDELPGFVQCRYAVGVVYVYETYEDKPTVGNKLLSDITTAVASEYRYTTPSGKKSVAYLREMTSEVQTDEDGGPWMSAVAVYKVEYRHAVGDQTELP